ncbi:MAG TPA: FKBP-type peptidyl-prolyl cis-trans isomerase [Anaerolineae bacterium]|nr:FKBP-type peptidyl-prolyl cis-trans isomerase [Anaerolineae bacterium]
MKKILAILMMMLLVLAACGPATPAEDGDDNNESDSNTNVSETDDGSDENDDDDSSSGEGAGGAEYEGQGIVTDSGLRYIEKEAGSGAQPQVGDLVEVHYVGTLLDGTQFDSSRDRGVPFSFPLGQGRVIAGWDEGIALMKEGGTATLVIPPELGYGAQGAGASIPPNSTLVFEVELVSISEPPTPVPTAPPLPTPTMSPDETETESGLRYEILVEGDGEPVDDGDIVEVHYVGTLADGTQFDSSRERGEPFAFPLGRGAVIQGWDEGIALLNVGTQARFIIPPELGYGPQDNGVIPPNSTLIFEVEVMGILPPPPEAPEDIAAEDYEETETGLQYYVFEEGDGETLPTGATVRLHVTMWTEDGASLGSTMESGQPLFFGVGAGRAFPGWEEAVSLMSVGSKWQVIVPPELAFGETGSQDGVIPPNMPIVLQLEVLSLVEAE